ncbi:MAG: hypothetical protein E6G41_06575 [Actinobacteria bacterium]|nr:MAG: hypothetical protein E6G41_06575 [Actinomycetota bacterium]
MMMLELPEIVGRYARGLFPMEDGWYAAEPRAVFLLDDAALDTVRSKLARSLRRAGDFRFHADGAFSEVIERCARPRDRSDGVWLTPWIAEQYARAAFLESMFHTVPHAGNVLLVRTLEHLAAAGFALADIQTPTDHTLRLGAVQLSRDEFERRLATALGLS